MTTTVRKVQQAPTPQQAMLAIAEALDRIEAQLLQQPTPAEPDPWGVWTAPDTVHITADPADVKPAFEQAFKAAGNDLAIQAVEAALEVEADAEERRALEAKLRLLKDEGAAIIRREAGVRVQSIDGGDTVTVDLPPADEARQHDRRGFATSAKLHAFLTVKGLTEEEFVEAYAKGGAMWLYLGDRDAIMAMPPEYRVLMVADIEEDSPAQAQEVARDLLMDRGAEGTTAVDRIYGE